MLNLAAVPPLEGDPARRFDALVATLQGMEGDPVSLILAGTGVLADAVSLARAAGAHEVSLELYPASAEHDMVAGAAGLALRRQLLQLCRFLPVGRRSDLVTRAFRPGTADEEAWLDVNNRAFHWHPDQADWTIDDLHARMAEPWFDADGFRLFERDGRLAGFCWTKVHADESPAMGEIFVIGVDPDFQGQGLGTPLVLAGLDWLADHGLDRAMLFVEADNAAALAVYRSLGFGVHTSRRWYGVSWDSP